MIKVSIIIPTHLREKKCERTVYSILKQSYKNIEILISNDSEKDYDITKDVYKDKRVKYFKKIPEGFDANYSFLYKKAIGDYIYCLEDDDYLINPNIIKNAVEVIENNKNINAVIMDYTLTYEDYLIKKSKNSILEILPGKIFFKKFPKMANAYQHSQVIYKASLIKKIAKKEIKDNLGSVNTDALLFLMTCLEEGYIAHLHKIGYMLTFEKDNQSWGNYLNCFFGGNSYIQKVSKIAKDIIDIDIAKWKDTMEEEHIKHLLKYLPDYLEKNNLLND